MAASELTELKTQLEELQRIGFIRPARRPRDLGFSPKLLYIDKSVGNLGEKLLPDLARDLKEQSFSTRLQLVLHQASSDQIQSGSKDSVPDSPLDYAMQPLVTRRPNALSLYPH
jgi:hypothetical protein